MKGLLNVRASMCMAAVVGMSAASASAQPGVQVDDYTTPQFILSNPGPDTGVVSGAGILGGERAITQNATVDVDISGGTMTLTNIGNFNTIIRFEYDGTGASPLSVDLTSVGSEFGINVISSVGSNNIERVRVDDSVGGGNRSVSNAFDLSTPGEVVIPYSAIDQATGRIFNPDPPADFTDIARISVEFRIAVGGSLVLENFRVLAGTNDCLVDLSSPTSPGVPDGALTGADFFEFLDRFSAGDLSIDFSSPTQPGTPDGALTGADFFEFLDLFAQGC